MHDPKAKNQAIFRVTGVSGSLKEHIEKHPQYAGLMEIDETTPHHKIAKKELARLIACRIIPFFLESFAHYKPDEELLWECGVFDDARIDKDVSEVDVRQAREILETLLQQLK